jgi:16S rRNA (cytidine1402-2'-O)-methyltransferase
MGRQKSQQTSGNVSSSSSARRPTGTLFIVGTPIGSPDDLTLRARKILQQVSIVVAETPLVTRALLDYHGIPASITAYAGGDEQKIAILLDRLNAGHDIALVSDSGMPVIYDPGQFLVAAARAAGHRVTVIPGPSALTAAAALSGYSGDRVLFVGRLPRAPSQLDRMFRHIAGEPGTTVLFASASVVTRLLERLRRLLPGKRLTLAINMTKADEQLYEGSAEELLTRVPSFSAEWDVTLVLPGARKRGR